MTPIELLVIVFMALLILAVVIVFISLVYLVFAIVTDAILEHRTYKKGFKDGEVKNP